MDQNLELIERVFANFQRKILQMIARLNISKYCGYQAENFSKIKFVLFHDMGNVSSVDQKYFMENI